MIASKVAEADLALVIPVRDDPKGLDSLLKQARAMDIFSQIVICDDGSKVPVKVKRSGVDTSKVTLLHQTPSAGAGVARNYALGAVRTSHMIYFDSDDHFTSELPLLWHEIQGNTFDFTLFRHHDSRMGGHFRWGQMPLDNAIWREAGAGHACLFEPSMPSCSVLAETSNYPWNKIYRTAFLREHDIRCSPTPVHNDIALHWLSFLHANKILVSERVAAVHEVNNSGNRLTNVTGAERLCVFEPLREVAQALAETDRPLLREKFFRFVAGLLDWVRTALAPQHHAELDRRSAEFLGHYLAPNFFDNIARTDPVLALRLVLQMAGGRYLSC